MAGLNYGLEGLEQHVNNSPAVQYASKAFHDTAQMVGDAIFKDNPLIRTLDAGTEFLRKETGTIKVNVADKGLPGDIGSAPLNTPKGENIVAQGRSQELEKSMVPERVREQVQAVSSNNGMGKGMECSDCNAADLGQFSPTPVSAGKMQTQSRGIA